MKTLLALVMMLVMALSVTSCSMFRGSNVDVEETGDASEGR